MLSYNFFNYIFSFILTHARATVVYETFPGWQQHTSHIRNYDELPQAAKNYISRIEELLGILVYWIGVGPDRDSMITITNE